MRNTSPRVYAEGVREGIREGVLCSRTLMNPLYFTMSLSLRSQGSQKTLNHTLLQTFIIKSGMSRKVRAGNGNLQEV